ncbi:hypothetical protein [Blastopirellula marina]|uniref:Uncharacterized protein n=1 Tax=Blastopirellula marina TaxID=124 RepID=A0A2S8GHK0_9BACT|nr:hypothetical protein [Blastopirellula marina]PQO43494.1 hypothetical protein C5Y93_22835 [Blastopirellula marina]
MNRKNLLLPAATAAALMLAAIAHGERPKLDVKPEQLDCFQPILKCVDRPLKSELDFLAGQTRLRLTLPKASLEPRWGTSLPAGKIEGEWILFVTLQPRMSVKDGQILHEASMDLLRAEGKRGITSLDNPLRRLIIGEYCYSLSYPSYLPTEEKELQVIREFVEQLSVECKLVDDTDPRQMMQKLILDP